MAQQFATLIVEMYVYDGPTIPAVAAPSLFESAGGAPAPDSPPIGTAKGANLWRAVWVAGGNSKAIGAPREGTVRQGTMLLSDSLTAASAEGWSVVHVSDERGLYAGNVTRLASGIIRYIALLSREV